MIVVTDLVGHIEGGEKAVNLLREGFLILDAGNEVIEIATGFFLDPATPHVDQLRRARWRRGAGQTFPHDHCDGVLKRGFLATDYFGGVGLLEAIVEHGGDVVRHAFHTQRANSIASGLLNRLEYRSRVGTGGRAPCVKLGIMAGDFQRHRVAQPARDRNLGSRELA